MVHRIPHLVHQHAPRDSMLGRYYGRHQRRSYGGSDGGHFTTVQDAAFGAFDRLLYAVVLRLPCIGGMGV